MPYTVPLGRPNSPVSSARLSRPERPESSRSTAEARSIDWIGFGTDKAYRFVQRA